MQLLESGLKNDDKALVNDTVAQIRTGVQECYEDVRELLLNFRERLHKESFAAAIATAIERFEIQTKLSTGKCARGYYNILQKDAVAGGHIKYEDIAAAAFVTMPFMGRESHSVQFFCNDGSVAFSVYVGRENHQLIDSVVEAFHKAKAAFCFGS